MISLTSFTRPFVITLGDVPVASADTFVEARAYAIVCPFNAHAIVTEDGRAVGFGGWQVWRRPFWLAQQEAAAQ